MISLKKIFIKIFIIILIIIFFISFSYSYKTLNIENLAFVVALGIDSSDSKEIKVTFQFVNPPSTSAEAFFCVCACQEVSIKYI